MYGWESRTAGFCADDIVIVRVLALFIALGGIYWGFGVVLSFPWKRFVDMINGIGKKLFGILPLECVLVSRITHVVGLLR